MSDTRKELKNSMKQYLYSNQDCEQNCIKIKETIDVSKVDGESSENVSGTLIVNNKNECSLCDNN